MGPYLIFLAIPALAGLWITAKVRKSGRRKKWMRQGLPPAWLALLESRVPLYRRLPVELKNQLRGLIRIFIEEKIFEGCGGLFVTDEMKVVIAAQACVLLLNRKTEIYPKLDVILVYPSAFVAKAVSDHGWGSFVEQEQVRLGESWHQGIVVLSWDDIQHNASDIKLGHNVVLHEFAHQLDQEDGSSNGAPYMEKGSHYVSWARHLGEVYKELREAVILNQPTFLDAYGATNPAEFFAVLTETFFEKPRGLKKNYPKLYEELKNYYKLDPVYWEVN